MSDTRVSATSSLGSFEVYSSESVGLKIPFIDPIKIRRSLGNWLGWPITVASNFLN